MNVFHDFEIGCPTSLWEVMLTVTVFNCPQGLIYKADKSIFIHGEFTLFYTDGWHLLGRFVFYIIVFLTISKR